MLKTLISSAVITLILMLTGCSTADKQVQVTPQISPPAQSVFKTYTAEDFYKTTSVFGSSINHDGTAVLVSNDKTGIFNAYKVPVDGSEITQLTFSTEESVFVKSWFPNDNRFLFSADKGGDELDHLFVQDVEGNQIDLTPGEGLKAVMLSWHENDESFFALTNERDAKYFDIYQYNTDDYSRNLVYKNDLGYTVETMSPNGRFIVLSKDHSNSNTDLYLVDLRLKMAKPRLITEHQGNVSYSAYTFTKDNEQLLYSTNEFGEFKASVGI